MYCSLETSKVPEKIMKKFKKSLIYNKDGIVRGAYVGDLRKYMTDDEITNKMSSIAISSGAKRVKQIFMGYKPRMWNGCKEKCNWICMLVEQPYGEDDK